MSYLSRNYALHKAGRSYEHVSLPVLVFLSVIEDIFIDFNIVRRASHYEKPAREISKELTFLTYSGCLTVLANFTYNVAHGVELHQCLV